MKNKLIYALSLVLLLPLLLFGCVKKYQFEMPDSVYTLPVDKVAEENKSVVDKDDNQYFGHSDTVMTTNGDIYCFYVKGHGKGALKMKKSSDFGRTWSADLATPSSWENSNETPTIYGLDFQDGSRKYILITGVPGWGKDGGGFATSISTDECKTFSEFTYYYDQYVGDEDELGDYHKAIVAMASLTHLKDADGNYIDKWMGVYHNYDFINYKTYLTFDENGNEQWSKPEPYLSQWRDIEKEANLCEVEMVRSPDGKELMLLARANAHKSNSYGSISTDEGLTWSEPKELFNEITGERHKAEYDAKTGKLLVSFRGMYRDGNNMSPSGWIGWIGEYSDIRAFLDNDPDNDIVKGKNIVFSHEYNPRDVGGYAGVVADGNGNFNVVGYGNFDMDCNNPYILSVIYSVE